MRPAHTHGSARGGKSERRAQVPAEADDSRGTSGEATGEPSRVARPPWPAQARTFARRETKSRLVRTAKDVRKQEKNHGPPVLETLEHVMSGFRKVLETVLKNSCSSCPERLHASFGRRNNYTVGTGGPWLSSITGERD
jgi:hypothetical protein